MADKLTIQDYLDFFGDKSKTADEALESTFGQGKGLTEEQLMMIIGSLGPGGKAKMAGKAVAKGGRNIFNILRELVGKGKPEIGDVAFKRRSQPFENIPNLIQKPLGQQELFSQEPVKQAVRRALQLPKQEIGKNLPALRMKEIPNMSQGPINVTETLNKIRRLQDEVAELSGRVVGGPLFRRIKK